jgi:hypothetical protein
MHDAKQVVLTGEGADEVRFFLIPVNRNQLIILRSLADTKHCSQIFYSKGTTQLRKPYLLKMND